jgi:asparagine synthase (glutamine-hydrolysing)
MSTIFGMHLSGERAMDPNAADAVSTAMRHWTPDDSGEWRGEGVVLGHLMLRNTPESLHEHNPFTQGECTIVADARLDNRDEVLQALIDERDLDGSSPDSHLILRLYQKYGASCTERLVGDFAFAVWDERSRELFCARDQMGVKPFFYHVAGRLFVFASEPRGVLAHPQVKDDPDEDFVFRLIAGVPPDPGSTFHAAVRRLPPGCMARYGDKGLEVQRYWSLRRPGRLLKGDTRELHQGFRDTLSRAVKDRLRSIHPVGCELSGGLDSSSVTSLAADLIDDRGRLHTFSAVLAQDVEGRKPFLDEEEYADEVIRHAGILNAVKVSSSGRTGLFEAQDLEIEVCRGVDVFSSFWLEPFRRAMSQKGIRTSLSGFLGDELVTHHGRDWYEEFLVEGRPAAYMKASVAARGLGPSLRGLAGRALPEALRRRLRGGPPMTRHFGLLKKEAVHLDRLARIEKDDPDTHLRYKDRLIRNATNPYARQRIQSESIYGIRHGIESRYPLADIRLLDYVLALPAEALGSHTIQRRLVRESLQGTVSERILRRTDKQVAAGVFYIPEERKRAEPLREWLRERTTRPMHPVLEPLDMESVLRTLDPEEPSNLWEGAFYPQLSFQIQCLLRYFQSE